MLRMKKYINKKKSKVIQFLKDFTLTDEIENFALDEHDSKIESFTFSIYYFYLYLKQDLDISLIKNFEINENINYQIVKDSFTNTWFFTCAKLVILHLKQADIHDFYLKYFLSKNYKFMIYKHSGDYVVFCTSHTSTEIELQSRQGTADELELQFLQGTTDEIVKIENESILSFLINNNYNSKSLLFSCFLRPESEKENEEYNTKDADAFCIKGKADIIMQKYSPLGFVILNNNYKYWYDNKENNYDFCESIGEGKDQKVLVDLLKIILKYIDEYSFLPINYMSY